MLPLLRPHASTPRPPAWRALMLLSILLSVLIGSAACGDDVEPDPIDDPADTSLPDTGFDADEGDIAEDDADVDEDSGRRPPPDDTGDFEFDEDLALSAVIPARGPTAGNTSVRFEGSGLNAETQIFFDDEPLETRFEGGQLVASTPPASSTGPVTVRAFNLEGDSVELINGYTYADPLQIESFSPSVLPSTGGIEVTARGRGFTSELAINVGPRASPRVTVISDELLRFVAPPHPAGAARVELIGPDTRASFDDALTYFDELAITSISPASGPTAGGQLVTITAEGLTDDTEVSFDGRPATIESINVSGGSVQVRTPAASAAGPADIQILSEHSADFLADAYYYDDGTAPSLLGLSPAHGDAAGGTLVSMAARGLDAPGAELRFGGQPATILTSGPTHALVQTPPGAPGTVDVTLHQDATLIDTLPDAFDYLPTLALESVTPSQGSSEGGEVVELQGEGLDQVTSVDFGGVAAAFTLIDSSTLEVTTPAAAPSVVDVRVRQAQRQATLPDAYRFVGEPEIWSFYPTRGAIAGNTFVTLQGQGFEGDVELTLGGRPVEELERTGPNTLTFRTPAHTAGPQELDLRVEGQPVEAPYPFTYFNPLSTFGGASGAPIDGAVNITVLTLDGQPIAGAFVMLSTRAETPYQGRTNGFGQLTLSGPDVLGPQVITATAPTFSTVTTHQVDAENLTLILSPIEPAEGEGGGGYYPPIGVISGEVRVTGKDSDIDSSLNVNLTRVRTTQTSMTGPTINPGLLGSIAGGEGDFQITTRTGDMALVAFCGHYDDETETFTPLFLGIERYLFVGDGQQLDVDLECDIPLNRELAVQLVDPIFSPDGPNTNRAIGYLDLGYEGFVRLFGDRTTLESLIRLQGFPAAEGDLDDITYAVLTGSYRSGGVPYSQVALENIAPSATSTTSPPLVAIPRPVSPASGGLVTDGKLRLGLDGVAEPDLFYIIARNAQGLPVWTFVVPGHERVVQLPELPDFSDLPADERPEPYQPGPLYVVAYGLRIDDFDFDRFSYADFSSDRWAAFSVNTWELRLSDD
ncbi:hypothetical protein FRC96_13795 [Lujinxingia vulgaris]|uniref:IPT/TIG domain-containing protein n=1 Tax=Lujinxingia vulgaris TaxID=2600176 RepID=A0A5C6X4Z9_9DELT|nr:IPT/TIG domain-containing protein [Lujinxingia vulgaris]TXD34680.1 hypothetical protein FRC96_13795 [Lujinxingia vulgaris]